MCTRHKAPGLRSPTTSRSILWFKICVKWCLSVGVCMCVFACVCMYVRMCVRGQGSDIFGSSDMYCKSAPVSTQGVPVFNISWHTFGTNSDSTPKYTGVVRYIMTKTERGHCVFVQTSPPPHRSLSANRRIPDFLRRNVWTPRSLKTINPLSLCNLLFVMMQYIQLKIKSQVLC